MHCPPISYFKLYRNVTKLLIIDYYCELGWSQDQCYWTGVNRKYFCLISKVSRNNEIFTFTSIHAWTCCWKKIWGYESNRGIHRILLKIYTILYLGISVWPLFHRNVASTELINKLWKRQWVWEIFESETHYICKIQINRKKSEMITKHEYCSCLTICLNQWNLSQVKAETCLFFQWIYEAVSQNLSWKSFSYSVQTSGSVRQILYAYVQSQ